MLSLSRSLKTEEQNECGASPTEVTWAPDKMVEVVLGEPDDFLKVRETLTLSSRASRKEKKIYQSCHHIIQTKKILSCSFQGIICS